MKTLYSRLSAPQNGGLTQKLLAIYEQVDVVETCFSLAPHGRGQAWRLRWRDGRHQRSLSVGRDPKIHVALRVLLEEWRAGGIGFLLHCFHTRENIPECYLTEMRLGAGRRAEKERHRQERQFSHQVPIPKTGNPPLTTEEKEEFRKLPRPLVEQLLQLQKEVNVLATNFNVCKRPDRNSSVLRWRESDGYGQITHRSLNLGTNPETAELVKKLIRAWRNWESPLLDLCFPQQAVPPEFWGIDTFHRIMQAFPNSPLFRHQGDIPFNAKQEMPEHIKNPLERGGFAQPNA